MNIVFLMPGLPAAPVGGYKIVFDYGEYICRKTNADVNVHFVYLPSRSLMPNTPAIVKFLARARQFAVAGSRLVTGRSMVPWRALDGRISTHLSLARLPDQLNARDVVIATAANTAHTAATLASSTGARGFYFLQHVEDWVAGSDFLHATYALGLEKVAVAPWIRDYCVRLGSQSFPVVLNAVDSTDYQPGPLVERRHHVGALLAPHNPRKGTRLAIAVLNKLVTRGIPCIAFGAGLRPSELSAQVRYQRDPAPQTLRSMYHECRIFICTSETEGFGLAPAEAALSGGAIVSTHNGGVDAYGSHFVRFCGNDTDGFTRAVLDLYNNVPELRARVAIGLRELADYTPERAAQAFARVVLPEDYPYQEYIDP